MAARETAFIQRLRRSWRLAGEPQSVFVGYSGGADSLALLSAMGDLALLEGFSLQAIHVDHGLRPESASDSEIVRANARWLDVPLVIERVPPDVLTRHAGVGPEEAMRRERYALFARVALASGAVVAVAHHRRDQAETVLLHLLRGAGVHGVAGMRHISCLPVPWWGDSGGQSLSVWRPFLGESSDVVRAVAEATGLPIVEDASNTDLRFRRNTIRHRIVPELEAAFPGAEATLARFADLAAIDADELDWQAEGALAAARAGTVLDRLRLMALRPAIRNRVVRLWLAEELPVPVEVSLERTDALLAVAGTPGARRIVQVAVGWSVEVTREHLRLQPGDRA